MSVGDSDLRIRPGRIRSTRAPKQKSFINQVLRAAKKAGHNSGQTGAGRRSGGLRALDVRPRAPRVQPRKIIQPNPARRGEDARGSSQRESLPLGAADSPSFITEARWRDPEWRAGRDVR